MPRRKCIIHTTTVNPMNWHVTKIRKINFKSSIAVPSDERKERAETMMAWRIVIAHSGQILSKS